MRTDVSLAQRSAASTNQARWRLVWRLIVIVLCLLLLAGAMVVTMGEGSVDIPADQVIQALRDRESAQKSVSIIVHEVRLPRALVGAMVGLNLAVSGALLQGVVRSPLADPYILGISAGGGLAAAMTTLLINDFPAQGVPLVALIGSLVGALLVYAVAWDGTGITTTRLALAGVALTTMFSALTTSIVVMTIEIGGQQIFQWLIGGLYSADWNDANLIAPYTIAGFFAAWLMARWANVLALGDEVAQGLGLRVERTRFLMIGVAAVLAGSAAAVAGLVGFVGLLVPFVLRRLVGSDYRILIPACAIGGAALMVWADTAARTLFPQLAASASFEFPVGIITAVIGGPLFLWLIRARRMQW